MVVGVIFAGAKDLEQLEFFFGEVIGGFAAEAAWNLCGGWE